MSDQIGEAIHQSINHVQLQRIQRCISGIGCSFSFTQGVQTIPGIEVIYHILHIDCIHHKANFCQKKKNIEKSVDQNTTCPSNTENSRYFFGSPFLRSNSVIAGWNMDDQIAAIPQSLEKHLPARTGSRRKLPTPRLLHRDLSPKPKTTQVPLETVVYHTLARFDPWLRSRQSGRRA